MGKRTTFDNQLDFDFSVPQLEAAALAGLSRQTSRCVSEMLHGERRSRARIAAEMSEMLDEDISKSMLDAYSSEAREGHRIPFDRMLALTAVTRRVDLLDNLMRKVGLSALDGEEVALVHAAHLRAQMKQLGEELKAVESKSKPIGRRGNHRD
jgi:hypothetical protein